jgi:mono/diheme cytochrome c family protein
MVSPRRNTLAAAIGALLAASTSFADESRLNLADAPGRDAVYANCLACHSIDYVLLHAGILDRKAWEASITKMRKVMGAPISEADARAILDYLDREYGKR